jgi:hypothetical protein
MSRRRTSINLTLVNLGVGELVAAAVFALFAAPAVIRAGPSAAPVWSALAPLLVVLVQAGVYWLVRSGTNRLPTPMAATYRVLRVFDVGLLGLGLVGIVLWWPAESLASAAVLAVWLFGVIEFTNYFVVRLAYPPSRWLAQVGRRRTPQLMKDLGPSRHALRQQKGY